MLLIVRDEGLLIDFELNTAYHVHDAHEVDSEGYSEKYDGKVAVQGLGSEVDEGEDEDDRRSYIHENIYYFHGGVVLSICSKMRIIFNCV